VLAAVIALVVADDRRPTPLPDADRATPLREEMAPLDPIAPAPREATKRAPIAPADWSVDRATDLHGVVTGLDGASISGAKVTITSTGRVTSRRAQLQGVEPQPIATLETDARGRYSVSLEGGAHYHLAFQASGHGRAWRHDRQAGERVDVSLAAAHAIHGCVRLDGEPVSDVTLRLGLYAPLRGGRSLVLESTRSAEDGTYRFTGLTPDAYTLRAVSTEAVPPPLAAIFVHDSDVQHDVTLGRGRSIFGRVVDDATEEPIVGAVVEAVHGYHERSSTTTNSDGEYRLGAIDSELNREGRPLTDLWILARIPTHEEARQTVPIRPHDVPDERVDLRLRRGVSVRGTLRFPGRATAPEDTEVTAIVRRHLISIPGSDFIRRSGHVSPSGAFVVEGVPAELPDLLVASGRRNAYEPQAALEVRAEGWRAPTLMLPRIEDDGYGLDVGEITLSPASSIQGRVIDDAGSPCPGVSVSVTEPVTWLPGTKDAMRVETFRPMRLAVTDDLGRFCVTGLPAGSSTVRTNAPGGPGGRVALTIELAPGEQRTDIEIVVERGHRIAGRVVTKGGVPVPGAIIRVAGEGFVETRSDGSFQAPGLGAGPYEVVAYLSDAAKRENRHLLPASRTGVSAGTNDLELVLSEGVFLRGRALGPDGEPVPGAFLMFRASDLIAGVYAMTSERGDFEVAAPAGLTFDVHFDGIDGSIEPWMREKNPLAQGYDPTSGPLVLRLP